MVKPQNEPLITIFPNPVHEKIFVDTHYSTNMNYSLIIYILTGQLIIEIKKMDYSPYIIETNSISNGLYFFVLLKDAEIIYKEKIIIE